MFSCSLSLLYSVRAVRWGNLRCEYRRMGRRRRAVTTCHYRNGNGIYRTAAAAWLLPNGRHSWGHYSQHASHRDLNTHPITMCLKLLLCTQNNALSITLAVVNGGACWENNLPFWYSLPIQQGCSRDHCSQRHDKLKTPPDEQQDKNKGHLHIKYEHMVQ